jgi:hypothetical protein
MSFEKGWINRQFARIERDAENWPSWMRREIDMRAESESAGSVREKQPRNSDNIITTGINDGR